MQITISKRVLMEIVYFTTLFFGAWQQSVPRSCGDTADALLLVSPISHHKLERLPATVSRQGLYDPTTVFDKYDITSIFLPYVQIDNWIGRLWLGDTVGPVTASPDTEQKTASDGDYGYQGRSTRTRSPIAPQHGKTAILQRTSRPQVQKHTVQCSSGIVVL